MVGKCLQALTRKNAELIRASGIERCIEVSNSTLLAAQTSIMLECADHMATFSAVYCLIG